jgi:predicted CoA-binding protein
MEQIQDFLDHKRIALVGVSRQPTDFSRSVFREFLNRGYDMVPVNPDVLDVEGRTCYAHLQDIQPPVDGVLFMTPPEVTAQLVPDCQAAGVKRVWMFRGAGHGAASNNTVVACEEQGMSVIPGECPFMFLPGTSWFHRFHGFVRKIRGAYPE